MVKLEKQAPSKLVIGLCYRNDKIVPRRFPGPFETLKPTQRVTGLLRSMFLLLLGMTVLAEESSQSSTSNIKFFPSSITLTSGQSWQRLLAWSRDTGNHHQDHTEELT